MICKSESNGECSGGKYIKQILPRKLFIVEFDKETFIDCLIWTFKFEAVI